LVPLKPNPIYLMKYLISLICLLACQHISLAQASATTPCALVFSESGGALVTNDSAPVSCREIRILSLPPATRSLTPVQIEFGMTGAFTFVKDPDLDTSAEGDIYIEDLLTGKVFDLRQGETYTFHVNRRIPERFVLHIDKMIFKYALSSGAGK
jgi:hypothetical protein